MEWKRSHRIRELVPRGLSEPLQQHHGGSRATGLPPCLISKCPTPKHDALDGLADPVVGDVDHHSEGLSVRVPGFVFQFIATRNGDR